MIQYNISDQRKGPIRSNACRHGSLCIHGRESGLIMKIRCSPHMLHYTRLLKHIKTYKNKTLTKYYDNLEKTN